MARSLGNARLQVIIELLALSTGADVGATLGSTTFTTEVATPSNPNCGVQIGNDGLFYAVDTTSYPNSSFRFTWKTGEGIAQDYQVRCDVVSGSIAGAPWDSDELNSPTGTWLLCSTNPKWGVYRTNDAVGQNSATITLTIRSASDGRTLATGTYTITAKVV